MLTPALEQWPEIAARLRQAAFAVFLDYDGTLTPVVSRPELAVLEQAQRQRLRQLAARHATAIITGRGMDDVRDRVGLTDVAYAANHGFEIVYPEGEQTVTFEVDATLRVTFSQAATELESRVGSIPGVVVEAKGYSVAVHYRLTPEAQVPAVEAAMDTVAAMSPGARRSAGKKVFELRPERDWHKGAAVAWLLERFGVSLPLYVGDDRTDEDAFKLTRERGGIAIFVGEPAWATAATYQLADPAATGTLLERLADL